jgi:hypothetical protein
MEKPRRSVRIINDHLWYVGQDGREHHPMCRCRKTVRIKEGEA